jgi:CCR4-NOT transcription complex subunit 3
MKKVDEGVELFDEIWSKVYSAEQQNQKEKYEIELKKEIKKLQRLRDQIKTWIGGTEVKDKDALLDARRLIETKMEQFKVCEKETKTKAYSKEGLAKQERLDPEEQKREDTISWISDIIDQIQTFIDEKELEVEKLSAGKGKKTNKNQLDEVQQHLSNHKFHLNKLEGIMRLVRNGMLEAESVDEVKEDLEYYCESHQDDDYIMAYDEDSFYDTLGLDDLDVVNVDRVTQVNSTASKKKEDDSTSMSSGDNKGKAKKSAGSIGIIPLTIGRARVSKSKSSGEGDEGEDKKDAMVGGSGSNTPSKIGRSISNASSAGSATGPTPTPTPKAPVVAPAGGASMAAVLKRESEERQKAALAAQQQVRCNYLAVMVMKTIFLPICLCKYLTTHS